MIRVLAKSMAFLLLLPAAFIAATGEPAVQALMDAGHWKRVRAQVMQGAQANPNDAEAAYLLSQVKQAFGDLQGALEQAEKSVALDGKKASYHTQLAEVCIQMGQNARIFKGMSLARRFRKESEAALALDPQNVNARSNLIEYYLEAPGIAGGDTEKARAIAEEIVKLDPVRGYRARALVAHKEKDSGKEEAALLAAVKASPKNYEAQAQLAGFYSSDTVKKYAAAEKPAREAVQIDPGRSAAYALLAHAFAKQDRAADLDAILAQAEKNVADDFGPHYQAGRTLLLDGKDLQRAEKYFRKYLTQEPEGSQPNWAAAHWRLGLVLEKQGRKAEAIGELQAAVSLDPALEEAKKDLKRLR